MFDKPILVDVQQPNSDSGLLETLLVGTGDGPIRAKCIAICNQVESVPKTGTLLRYDRAAAKVEGLVSPLSEFNTVLNQVLSLTEATTTQCRLLPPESVERHRCEGKLVALHQVIELFLAIDRQEFGAGIHSEHHERQN